MLSHLGGDGTVLVLVEDGEGLLEGGQLVGRQRLQDLGAVGLGEGRHGDAKELCQGEKVEKNLSIETCICNGDITSTTSMYSIV